ncbi:methyltransferase domain-containing protein [Trametes meyenii]|nr:methyltransferase domain-containing protein [Trametes meyenii]
MPIRMIKSPFLLGQRHPRYTFAFVALVVCGYFFFVTAPPRPHAIVYKHSNELQARLDREERKYRTMLPQRHELVTKYGPSPSQVVMFPPDQEPWPAYTVWDFFPPIFNCPHELDRLGSLGDGGKWICGASRIEDKPSCVIYSFGVDSTYSFEATLLQSTRFCELWIYDSTKGEDAASQMPRSVRHRVHFGKLALGAHDRHNEGDDPKTWTLKSLLAENGHSHVDFLRIDIEGWEWETLRAIVSDFTVERATPPHAASADDDTAGAAGWHVREREGALPFGQLHIELHIWNQRFDDFLEWWELLEAAGLRPLHSEINTVYANYNRKSGVELAEYTFLNIRGENAFVKDYEPEHPSGDSPA